MQTADYDRLITEIKEALAADVRSSFAVIGYTPLSYDLLAFFSATDARRRFLGIYSATFGDHPPEPWLKRLENLAGDRPDIAIIASDSAKEELLLQALPYLAPVTRIVLGGYSHFAFHNAMFDAAIRDSLVPSLANGYPYTLTHLFQCLQNAARLDLNGVVAEFGMFRGGTTMILSRLVEHLGRSWPVIGFDTFEGFPPRRSVLDMYAHPDCVFRDEASVRQYLAGRNVEVVKGDIVTTVARLLEENIVLAFIDTDNYTSATAALEVIQDRVLVGGAIVFDHFTGRNRFLYTLGERMAAKRLLDDRRYFNLHDTGVFLRQC